MKEARRRRSGQRISETLSYKKYGRRRFSQHHARLISASWSWPHGSIAGKSCLAPSAPRHLLSVYRGAVRGFALLLHCSNESAALSRSCTGNFPRADLRRSYQRVLARACIKTHCAGIARGSSVKMDDRQRISVKSGRRWRKAAAWRGRLHRHRLHRAWRASALGACYLMAHRAA